MRRWAAGRSKLIYGIDWFWARGPPVGAPPPYFSSCSSACSGAEDKHGYIWDRHYNICLARLAHNDVVNSVAFSPADQELLLSASDDSTIKVWRSPRMVRLTQAAARPPRPRGGLLSSWLSRNRNSTSAGSVNGKPWASVRETEGAGRTSDGIFFSLSLSVVGIYMYKYIYTPRLHHKRALLQQDNMKITTNVWAIERRDEMLAQEETLAPPGPNRRPIKLPRRYFVVVSIVLFCYTRTGGMHSWWCVRRALLLVYWSSLLSEEKYCSFKKKKTQIFCCCRCF